MGRETTSDQCNRMTSVEKYLYCKVSGRVNSLDNKGTVAECVGEREKKNMDAFGTT